MVRPVRAASRFSRTITESSMLSVVFIWKTIHVVWVYVNDKIRRCGDGRCPVHRADPRRTQLATRPHAAHPFVLARTRDRDVMTVALVRYLALGVLLLGLLPREAMAWSRDGHRIVCRIAWNLLDHARRAEIDRLTSTYRDPDGEAIGSYWDACAFADDVRTKARGTPSWKRFGVFETWHFANVPRSTTRLPTPPCQVPCVISAVFVHADSLRLAADDRSRSEALFFVSHWIGDLHQPLHVAFEDDRGGNSIRPIEGDYYSVPNLHALWDGALLGKLQGSTPWLHFADSLALEISPAQRETWRQGSPADWAQESYNLVTSKRAQYCQWEVVGGTNRCAPQPGSRRLGAAYQQEFGDDVAMRLQRAGVRLAHTLQANLTLR